MYSPRRPVVAAVLTLSFLMAACSADSSPGGLDAAGGDAGADGQPDVQGAALSGTVTDKMGDVVIGAMIDVAGVTGFSDAQGKYSVGPLPAGPATVSVTGKWWKPWVTEVTISGATRLDVTLEELPLAIDPADRALAEEYARTFDWTRQSLSLVIVARPTRRDFDNAVYFHNPALYRDTSAQPTITPTPAPEIGAGGARNFSFPLASGSGQGQEALEVASIVDAIGGTPLGATEPADHMLWTPMINWLAEGEAARSAELRAVGVAVRQQSWGSNAIRPQEIEKVYLDASGGLWVKVVFARFVQLGPGINDDDGDGLPEIFARVAPAQVPAELVQKLRTDYASKTFSTHGLSKELARSLNELYSTTAAQVERTIGQPFEVPGLGTIRYPFVVLRHSLGQRNVILVAPAP